MAEVMRAARFLGDGRIEVRHVAVPEPGPNDVLVKVHSCALSGTDRQAYIEGSETTPGHEISGTVVSAGAEVDDVVAGQRGVVYLVDFCGACYCCRAGSTNMCLDKRRITDPQRTEGTRTTSRSHRRASFPFVRSFPSMKRPRF